MQAPQFDYLIESIVTARDNTRGRWLTFVVIALCFGPLTSWPFAACWLFATLMLSEVVWAWLIRMGLRARPARVWPAWGVAFLGTYYLTLSAMAIAAGFQGGVWGLVAGEFLLFCLILMGTATARRSAAAFYATVAPVALSMGVLAAKAFSMSEQRAGPVILAVGTCFVLLHTRQIAFANRRVAIEREEAKASAEASTAAKSAFVAMVSHELRTPISGILAGAAELRDGARTAKDRRHADLVVRSAEMMRVVLNDLLDLSKIEAGRMEVENVPFDLRAGLLEALRFWRPELRRKGLYLRFVGSRNTPGWVLGDPVRLRQILNNLLSNAAKFTERGGVAIRVAVQPGGDAAADRLTIEVRDTGPGMSAEQLARLFSAYEQLGASTANAHGGTGLGLHISRALAQLMGGEIRVQSALGEGTTFRVELPLISGEPASAAHVLVNTERASELRVLIVDDHAVNRQAFSLMLQPFAAEVVSLENGEAALGRLALEPFDLVLMDVHMPMLDGLEATRRLRAAPGPNQHTPVIALTGAAAPADAGSYLAAGINAWVVKPVTAAELVSAIAEALDPRSPDVEGGARAAQPT